MKIVFSKDQVLDLENSLSREYLLTNGLGGYCSSTIVNCHTRKYHSLLAVAYNHKRFCLLSRMDASLKLGKQEFYLFTNKFPGVFSPTGHQFIQEVRAGRTLETAYRVGDILLNYSIAMVKGENTVLFRYQLEDSHHQTVTLVLRPFLSYREIHHLMQENMAIRQRCYVDTNGFKIDPYENMPPLYIHTSLESVFYHSPEWWRNFEYLKEKNRGYDYQEDLFCPGLFEVKLEKGNELVVSVSTQPAATALSRLWQVQQDFIHREEQRFSAQSEPLCSLKTSALDYLIQYPDQSYGIIAGYHWFGEWGRDTLISLPGICFVTGELAKGLKILEKYAGYVKQGILPNIVTFDGSHAYNSVDSSLLYFWAVQQYLGWGGEKAALRPKILPALKQIVFDYLDRNTAIAALGEDGFIYTGNNTTNYTWMDASVHGVPVTPRFGAPVEITSLWYNALRLLQKEGGDILAAEEKGRVAQAAAAVEENFMRSYWHEENQTLSDVFHSHHDKDNSIRPNQLFALGLPYSLVPREQAQQILATVKQHLVTPYGLRSLSPQNVLYQGEYRGSQEKRDKAYHQGTVWAFLIGIFSDAVFAVEGRSQKTKQYILEIFGPLFDEHLKSKGLNQISEVFSGNPPYHAKGCIAQAWSVAEAVRVLELCGRTKTK